MKIDLSFQEWMGLLTTLGILATFGLSLYIWLRHTRPSCKVKVSLGFVTGPGARERVMATKFINERGPVVVIEEVGFECADGTKAIVILPGGDRLPTAVPPGHSAHYSFDLEEWRTHIQAGEPMPVRAYCRSTTDHYYRTPLSRAIRDALLE